MKLVFGIGKHGDAPTARTNRRSPWDTLHPARAWATTAEGKSPEKIADELGLLLEDMTPDLAEINQSFQDLNARLNRTL